MPRKSILTDEQKQQIRELREEGWTYPALAARFKVSQNTIIRICKPEYYTASLEANRKYQQGNVKEIYEQRKGRYQTYRLTLHKENDSEVIKKLDAQDNYTDYIRELVLDKIESDKTDDKSNE